MSKFEELLKLSKNSIATFSKYKVASIIETDNGVYSGVNIEPSVLNLGICAERNALFNALTNGSTYIKKIWLLTNSKINFGTPCGACRQLFIDYINEDTILCIYNLKGEFIEYKFIDLLPYYWSKKELN